MNTDHLYCGHCGAVMRERTHDDVDEITFDRRTGARLGEVRKVRVWACPEARIDLWLEAECFEDHDVEELA